MLAMQDLFGVVLSSLNTVGPLCGHQQIQSIRKVFEALQSLLKRDEAREQKHVQHVGGEKT